MLTTSRKRWEPAFNADVAVTRDGVVVSQFLSTDNNDFRHFEPALYFVIETLGRPAAWMGDGHYGTMTNIVIASREGVILYAPRSGTRSSALADAPPKAGEDDPLPRSLAEPRKATYTAVDFRRRLDKDVVICPAGEELRFIGEYPTDGHRGSYRLYGRRKCEGCELKPRCTSQAGRRVKLMNSVDRDRKSLDPSAIPKTGHPDSVNDEVMLGDLLRAHDERMENGGKAFVKLRGHTSEPANAHLHLHGLRRFHVRGFARCGAVLALACMAHNLRKWAAKAMAERISLAS
jgi:hypothetical protein